MTNLITTATKAKSSSASEAKVSSNKKKVITPDITRKLPMVVITLATVLPKEEVEHLEQWFHRNVHPRVLLDIHIDPKLIGGCRFIWQGLEGDFSLRKRFRKKTEDGIEDGD